MRQKILDFFSFYSKYFKELNTQALCNMYYIPNAFIFNVWNGQVKEFTISQDLQDYLQSDLVNQLNLQQPDENSIEILRIHSITQDMFMAEANWTHNQQNGSNYIVIKCLFILLQVNEELKIASTTFS